MTNEINLLVNDSKTLAALQLHNFRNKVSGEKVLLENISRRAQKKVVSDNKYTSPNVSDCQFSTINFNGYHLQLGVVSSTF